MTDREKFLTLVSNLPLLRGDAIVVLAGEDAMPRLTVAAELLAGHTAGTQIVLSGGVHEPPQKLGAKHLAPHLMGLGVAPQRISVEGASLNTRAQAINVTAIAKSAAWRRVLLVASAYHIPRAFLTFVQAVDEAGLWDTLHVVPMSSSQAPWFGSPAGVAESRFALLSVELRKIDEYFAKGHVASYARGLDYIEHWEDR